jgi:hypothetical protein
MVAMATAVYEAPSARILLPVGFPALTDARWRSEVTFLPR